jgi:hypothetical protein
LIIVGIEKIVMRYSTIYLLLCLCVGCHRVSIEKKIERSPPSRSPEYHVLIASWYGPTPGAGFSGSDINVLQLGRNLLNRFRIHFGKMAYRP